MTESHLVNEYDRIPARRDVQNAIQSFVKRACGGAKVSTANDVQRTPYVLARRLRRQSLSNTWRSKQVNDQTVAFPLYEVVEARLVVRLHERF